MSVDPSSAWDSTRLSRSRLVTLRSSVALRAVATSFMAPSSRRLRASSEAPAAACALESCAVRSSSCESADSSSVFSRPLAASSSLLAPARTIFSAWE